jgi:hypothetical protein
MWHGKELSAMIASQVICISVLIQQHMPGKITFQAKLGVGRVYIVLEGINNILF